MKIFTDWEEFTDNKLCNAWVATAVIGGAAIGAGATIYEANKAASAQENATNTAANTNLSMYNRTREDLSPYNLKGIEAEDALRSSGYFASPIRLTQDWLESTPGYQFTKTQGLKAVQNSAAARGLGVSGAALKGAATFATGLADNTYKTQFDVENTNRTNAYNRLKGIVDLGENAAAQTGTVGAYAANNAGAAQIGGGNAAAAGYNATGGAINSAANNIAGYAAYKGLYGGGGNTASELPNYGTNSFVGPLPA